MTTQTLLKPRKRLKRKRKRLLLPNKALHKPHNGATSDVKFKANAQQALASSITPETLAYSLPGGLAKLAFPNWIYGAHIKAVEDYIIRILNGESIKLMVSMPPRHGKSLKDATSVLTLKGWTKHGKLKIGDYVFGLDGKPTRVVGLSKKVNEFVPVKLSNGEIIWCHLNHEWLIKDRSLGKWLKLETRDIIKRLHTGNRNNITLPDTKAVEFPEIELPLHPYVLGAWLGDGSKDSTRIIHHKNDLWVTNNIKNLGYPISASGVSKGTNIAYTCFASKINNGRRGVGSKMFEALKELQVLNNKHIPEIYLRSSVEQRLQLLAGLLDTDGYVDKMSRCIIVTASKKLRKGIMDLCITLGFRPYYRSVPPEVSTSGIVGRKTCYYIGFQPYMDVPTKIPRKKIKRFAVRRRVSINNIGEVKKSFGRSIMVDAEDGIYLVGKNLNPTHNTMFLSRVLPAFFLGRFPDTRVMLITHHTDFSRTQSRVARNIIDAFGKTVFDIEISPDTASAGEWDIAGGQGGMEALGAGGSVMGKGANLLLMDDLVKGIEMASNVGLMEKQWEWFKTDVYPRLEPGASAIIIMTRWTTYDIIGMIEAEIKEDPTGPFDDWETINFPAYAIEDDVLGRAVGEPLFPERINKKMLDRIKGVSNDHWFEAMYQGNPVPAKGDIIDTDWIGEYEKPPNRRKLEMLIISADTAQKETEIADFTAIGIWGILDGQYYLLDLIRDKMIYPALIAQCRALNEYWKADFFLIEDKGSGQSLVQELQNEDGFNIVGIDPGNENKVLRLMAETPSLRAGKVLFPKEASWLDHALLELRAFPRGKKDIADQLSQFLKFMRKDSNKLEMW